MVYVNRYVQCSMRCVTILGLGADKISKLIDLLFLLLKYCNGKKLTLRGHGYICFESSRVKKNLWVVNHNCLWRKFVFVLLEERLFFLVFHNDFL